MQFVNEYKNRGGKVVVGSDTGYLYSLYGFGYIQELELLQEAGFHPLEVIRAATKTGAQVLGVEQDLGTLHVGKKPTLSSLTKIRCTTLSLCMAPACLN